MPQLTNEQLAEATNQLLYGKKSMSDEKPGNHFPEFHHYEKRIAALESAIKVSETYRLDFHINRIAQLEAKAKALEAWMSGEIAARQALEAAAEKQEAVNGALLAVNGALLAYIEAGIDTTWLMNLREALKR